MDTRGQEYSKNNNTQLSLLRQSHVAFLEKQTVLLCNLHRWININITRSRFPKLIPVWGRCKMQVIDHMTEYDQCKAFQNNNSLWAFFSKSLPVFYLVINMIYDWKIRCFFGCLTIFTLGKPLTVIYITVIKTC